MAQTNDLIQLIDSFPQAFSDPEVVPSSANPGKDTPTERTQQLLGLMESFPQAFADPEALPAAAEPVAAVSEPQSASSPAQALSSTPPGYTPALRRRVQTIGWGTADFTLIYSGQGLTELWVTVGKSGTEVQALCEAIARLVNLLLAEKVAIADIVREIRGIRGADSEGLGPHRFLGLADLIGKVLQEAPPSLEIAVEAQQVTPSESPVPAPDMEFSPAAVVENPSENAPLTLGETDGTSLCPDCGAELQQAHGCKGGACLVCGYSSCS